MSDQLYRPVDPKVNFPALEEGLIESWDANDIFRRSVENREGCPEWVFYEGPPTANNKPGIHHVEARVFKDLFCRFHSMNGRLVHRKAGWDCHGLAVEVEVEKELGITNKRQIIDEVTVEAFVARCKESVQRYVRDWERMTRRVAFWVDLDEAYWTMTPDYVESVWWILKEIWDKGLLEEDFKVVPYCPRCETSLSSHEQHQTGAYKTVVDPSVYVRFPLEDNPDLALLVWTTTPWTLLANMAVAAGPYITYAEVDDPGLPGKRLIVAADAVERLFGENTKVHRTLDGRDLIRDDVHYLPPFPFVDRSLRGHTVRTGDFVTTEDGSGLVHLAPYGEDDMAVAKRDDLPIKQMIDGTGRVMAEGGKFAGLWVKDADPKIIEDLDERDLLFRAEDYEHAYPHCWRCGTPLLYYARKDWYIRTSQIRPELQESNEDTNWQPPTIKYGRFGDWLANNVDWSLSRDRFWGTPLPIWRCPDEHTTCIGSFSELAERAGRDLDADPERPFDPHRPYVDDITFPCPQCGKEARRVTSVIDAWFDSGSMPFAQWHYPFENAEVFERRYPADFISEAIDQTRGWFYSLLAVSTLIRGHNSFRNVVCLGHIVDSEGRKMSKSVGNVLDPWSVLDVQGADALRWYMITGGTPWSARRVGPEIIEETLRRHILTLWNTYSFWVTYASLENFDPSGVSIPVAERPETDRWILAELDDTVRVVTDALEMFDATRGGKRIERFVDDLSNWYVRRSRRRFWRSARDADTQAAFLTLWECLTTVAQLAAPYTPFVSDEIYSNLTAPIEGAPDSVHLSDWPQPDDTRVDDDLRARMALVRRLVALGRSARTEAKIRVRQPLARALIVVPSAEAGSLAGLETQIAEELNVKALEAAHGVGELVTYTVKPNFKELGPRFGPKVKVVAGLLAEKDPHDIVTDLEATGTTHLELEGADISLSAKELDVRVEGRAGFSLAQDGAYGVALDMELTPELIAEGNAREVVRAVQDLRKSSGLAVEDRIELWLGADDRLRGSLGPHEGFISGEVLSTATRFEDPPPDAPSDRVEVDGGTVTIAIRKS
ncbi:MAG TPA: isoleucine--tRNA ligase [Actinomycetota bacterium]|nr:isoleucine--tRNA ligase [Actinomycetota bacterium]